MYCVCYRQKVWKENFWYLKYLKKDYKRITLSKKRIPCIQYLCFNFHHKVDKEVSVSCLTFSTTIFQELF